MGRLALVGLEGARGALSGCVSARQGYRVNLARGLTLCRQGLVSARQ